MGRIKVAWPSTLSRHASGLMASACRPASFAGVKVRHQEDGVLGRSAEGQYLASSMDLELSASDWQTNCTGSTSVLQEALLIQWSVSKDAPLALSAWGATLLAR